MRFAGLKKKLKIKL